MGGAKRRPLMAVPAGRGAHWGYEPVKVSTVVTVTANVTFDSARNPQFITLTVSI